MHPPGRCSSILRIKLFLVASLRIVAKQNNTEHKETNELPPSRASNRSLQRWTRANDASVSFEFVSSSFVQDLRKTFDGSVVVKGIQLNYALSYHPSLT